MHFRAVSYLTTFTFGFAAYAAPNPTPRDKDSPANTVPIAWHDIEAGAYAARSSEIANSKRSAYDFDRLASTPGDFESIDKSGPEFDHKGSTLWGRDPHYHHIPVDDTASFTKIEDTNMKRRKDMVVPSGRPDYHWSQPDNAELSNGYPKESPSTEPIHHGDSPMRRNPSPDDTPEQMNDWALARFCEHHPNHSHCEITNHGKRATAYRPCEGVKNACVGDVTHYDGGQSACGPIVDTNTEMVVALPHGLMGAASNSNPYCGRQVMIKNPQTGALVGATVKEKCMGCEGGSIDLTNALFNAVAPGCDGRFHGYLWWFV